VCRVFSPSRLLKRDLSDIADKFWDDLMIPRFDDAIHTPVLSQDEDDENYIFRAEMPGVPKESIELTVKENLATLRSKQEQEQIDKDGKVKKRMHRHFSASFTIPGRYQPEKISAEAKDGIITIVFPKAEEVKNRKIEVK